MSASRPRAWSNWTAAVAGCCRRAVERVAAALAAERLFGPTGAAPIAQDQLLRAALESAPICDVELERLLTGIRRVLLDRVVNSAADLFEGDLLGFFCALARQCFINEYVYDCTAEEIRTGRGYCGSGSLPPWRREHRFPRHGLWRLPPMVRSTYSRSADKLLQESWPAPVAALLTQQIAEPREEQSNRGALARLTAISDAVSLEVKGQYEENPYPRWVKVVPAGRRLSAEEYFGTWYRTDGRSSERDTIDILVAGCGTGQSLIETAGQLRGANVLAIDLSVASLCYAKRQARVAGLANITFAEADILELGTLRRTFDAIDAGGVLHHLADPWRGWRVLLSLLRPGGLMRVGLYSRLARRHINAARAYIAARGYSPTAEDIRRGRQDILSMPDDAPVKEVSLHADFYTVSECRDVLFHVAGTPDDVARNRSRSSRRTGWSSSHSPSTSMFSRSSRSVSRRRAR